MSIYQISINIMYFVKRIFFFIKVYIELLQQRMLLIFIFCPVLHFKLYVIYFKIRRLELFNLSLRIIINFRLQSLRAFSRRH